MPSLKDTKRRIVSVKNTQKITQAMKLVSSAKYARASRAIANATPYRQAFTELTSLLLQGEQVDSPLVLERREKKSLLVILTTDRGLCGSLNASLLKACQNFLDAKARQGVECQLKLWGRRAILFGQKRDEQVGERHDKVLEKPSYSFAMKAAQQFCADIEAKHYDRIYFAYSHFHNALTQEARVQQILPISQEVLLGKKNRTTNEEASLFLWEPERLAMFSEILVKQVAASLFHMLLSGAASEHAARMTAMDSATTNAEQVISSLTLAYNRARQAAITKELIEITSGAEAL